MSRPCMVLSDEDIKLLEKYSHAIPYYRVGYIQEMMAALAENITINAPVALIQTGISSQVQLLRKLNKEGLLK